MIGKLSQRGRHQYLECPSQLFCTTPPFPTNMMIETTNYCNHACVFCANRLATRPKGSIPKELLFSILEQAAALGVTDVGFYSTGEPLSYPHLVHAVAKAKKLGFKYTYISTNGELATPSRIIPVVEAGLDSLKFSINAGTSATYHAVHGKDTFNKLFNNVTAIYRWREETNSSLYIASSTVLPKDAETEREAILKVFEPFMDEMIFSVQGAQAGHISKNEAELRSISASKAGVCALPFNRIHVTCEGYLTLCCVDFQNYLAGADLNKGSLSDCWHSDSFVEMRKRMLDYDIDGTLCGRCRLGSTAKIEPLKPELATYCDFNHCFAAMP